MMSVFNLGLYAVLFETAQNNIQVLVNRQMIDSGYAPAYKQLNKINADYKYDGADTGVLDAFAC